MREARHALADSLDKGADHPIGSARSLEQAHRTCVGRNPPESSGVDGPLPLRQFLPNPFFLNQKSIWKQSSFIEAKPADQIPVDPDLSPSGARRT